jgi:hypothetical protein
MELNWQKVFPKNPNTFNLFLLDMGAHVVEHLEGSESEFESKIIETCRSSRLFASWRNASYGLDLMKGTDESRINTLKIFALIEDYLMAIQVLRLRL